MDTQNTTTEVTTEVKTIMSKDELVAQVLVNCKLEDGSLDYDKLDALLKDLKAVKDANKEEHKKAVKDAKDLEKLNNSALAVKYLKTLKAGTDVVSYKMADGTINAGVYVKNTDKTATIDLGAGHESKAGKTTRTPRLSQIIIPQEFLDSLKAELDAASAKSEEVVA